MLDVLAQFGVSCAVWRSSMLCSVRFLGFEIQASCLGDGEIWQWNVWNDMKIHKVIIKWSYIEDLILLLASSTESSLLCLKWSSQWVWIRRFSSKLCFFSHFFAPYFWHINGDRSEANWYWTSMRSGWDTLATTWKRTRSQKPRCLSVVDSLWSEVGAKLCTAPLLGDLMII